MLNSLIEGRAKFGAAFFLLAGLFGCTTTSLPPQPVASVGPTAGPTTPVDAGSCRSLINQADLGNEATMLAIAPCRFTSAGEQASREALGSSAGDALWAALWVYGASGSDPAPLRPIAGNDDPSIRVMAAAALVSFGDASGFPVLVQELTDDDQLNGSQPPTMISSFALTTAIRYVVGAGVPAEPATLDETSSAQSAWAGWLAAHEASLVFNGDDGTWSLP